MSLLVAELKTNPDGTRQPSGNALDMNIIAALAAAATSPVGIAIVLTGAALNLARWVYTVFQNTPDNVASLIGYIVDLTYVMHRLFSIEVVNEETVVAILKDFRDSGKLEQIHADIRKFLYSNGALRLLWGHRTVRDEIERLIRVHCV